MSFLKIILYIAIILGMIFIAQFLNVKHDILTTSSTTGMSLVEKCIGIDVPKNLKKGKSIQFCSCVKDNSIYNNKQSKQKAYVECLEKYKAD